MNSRQRLIAAISCLLATSAPATAAHAQVTGGNSAESVTAYSDKTSSFAPSDFFAVSDTPRDIALYADQPAMFSRGSEPPQDASVLFVDKQPLGLIGLYGSTDSFDFAEMERLSRPRDAGLLVRVWNDQLNFYSPQSLLLVGVSLGAGAAIANTQLDGDVQRHLQSSLHHANSDDWLEGLHANKELGDGRFTLPIFASAWALGSILPASQFSDGSRTWGQRTLRGVLVGAPPVLLLQRVTGSSRPGETASGSEWVPFRDNNGVSGHAFMGSLPFITAAKMSDSLAWKTTFYAASALAPLSRTADGAHYPSQVALGWSMAFIAATAVYSTDNPNSHWRVLPTATPNGSGMALEYRF